VTKIPSAVRESSHGSGSLKALLWGREKVQDRTDRLHAMTDLHLKDFYNPTRDTDSSDEVVILYRSQFPYLYRAVDCKELKTSDGSAVELGGDTLITYKCAIRKIYGKYFPYLDPLTQDDIRLTVKTFSETSEKRIQYWDDETQSIINNHQLGNMMPFPSGRPSVNSLRASAPHYDYFDRLLSEVQSYYASSGTFHPTSGLQRAIGYQRGYFDFFRTYNNFIEDNLLQDFVGKDLWAITNFRDYVELANQIIDSRGKRFTRSHRIGTARVGLMDGHTQ